MEANGFTFVRQRGSHMILRREFGSSTITVPVPDHRELRDGTLRAIITFSKLPSELFEVA